jgi:hypothetical protein
VRLVDDDAGPALRAKLCLELAQQVIVDDGPAVVRLPVGDGLDHVTSASGST